MELRQLQYFSTLAETLNFRRAAERLHISQPPLTVAIRKLEDELGAPLFVRSSRGVALTDAGKAALEFARTALSSAGSIRRAVHEGCAGERGRLRIGFVSSAVYALLPAIIPRFRRRYPHVDLALEEMTSADIAPRLRARELDVGLVRMPLLDRERLAAEVVETDELVIALPEAHPLAAGRRLSLGRLADEAFVAFPRYSVLHAASLTACRDAGFAPRVAQEAAQVHTILSLVQSGLGVALVPSRAVRYAPDGVELMTLDAPPRIAIGLALRDEAPSPAAERFRAVAREVADIAPVSLAAG